MAPLGGTDLRLKNYGLDHHGDEVHAAVFADKPKKLVSGLKQLVIATTRKFSTCSRNPPASQKRKTMRNALRNG